MFKWYIWLNVVPCSMLFLATSKQLYVWFSPSTCLSVHMSVCLSHVFTMFLSLYHHEISRSNYQWQGWCLCKRWGGAIKCPGHRGQNPIQQFLNRESSFISLMAWKWCTKLDIVWKRCPIVCQGHPSNFKAILDNRSPIFFPRVTPVWILQWIWKDAQWLM